MFLRRAAKLAPTPVQSWSDRQHIIEAIDTMADGFIIFDGDHRLLHCNDQFKSFYPRLADRIVPGISFEELNRAKIEVGHVSHLPHPINDYVLWRSDLIAEREKSHDVRLDGDRWLRISDRRMSNGGIVGIRTDITELKRREQQLTARNVQFDTALNHMIQGLCMFDDEQRLIVCNQRYLEIYGFSAEIVKPGIALREIMQYSVSLGNYSSEDAGRAVAERPSHAALKQQAVLYQHLSDERVIAVMHRPMPGGGSVATYQDVTEQKRAEKQIQHIAQHDALTDLPNRILFRDRMEQALKRARRAEATVAILYLDLDHFKDVNDTLGHPAGDLLLQQVAQRVRAVLRDTDTVARLGGDEFAIIQADMQQPENSSTLAQRLINSLSEPYDLDGQHVVIGVSIGIATATQDVSDPDRLLKSADIALYRAKSEGRGVFRFYDSDMDARVQERRSLETDLRLAIAGNQLELFYQPLVNVASNTTCGFEALIRWHHPTRGMIPPVNFIPMAEETGQIVSIGAWALRKACCEAATWPAPIKVAVNLSPAQFKSRNLIATVAEALAESGLPANRLELEITESVLLQEGEGTLEVLHALRALGVRIAMDDFGTGYSSLSYLRSFPFDKIKIDRSFVKDLGDSKDAASIVRAVLNLGSSLGIATNAEGVETREQFDYLRREGCMEVQGYFFSRPRPGVEVKQMLRDVAATMD